MRPAKSWLWSCPECSFLRARLKPGGGRGVGGLKSLRRENFAILLRHLPDGGQRLLEIGSAEGWFLKAATEAGFDARGIEPSPGGAQAQPIDKGFFPQDLSDPGPYDIVVFNDVYEHFDDPVQTIRDVEALLAPGGRVVINLPMSSGILYRIAGLLDAVGLHGPLDRLWQRGLPSPHMTYFNRRNLTALVTRHTGLRFVESFPLPSFSRHGLKARIFSTSRGLSGLTQFVALWLLSFVIEALPADTAVLIFRK
ncbi:class I SAM-dependent methyltransferase [Govanella unica]|uniref:Class I SAM-dependent methyltransferase n=1 Tax=Govanella unica TaxID=2975056 RepID=A0A9X3TWP7_9PROT|nr:class I SAM-dependent methyltransferase [Govania unica]MDA5193136.1 class I SAM-dependent methyltransferase [Govania unica]